MKYPKIVYDQSKKIADFCDIKYLPMIDFIMKALFIVYLEGKKEK